MRDELTSKLITISNQVLIEKKKNNNSVWMSKPSWLFGNLPNGTMIIFSDLCKG